MSTSSSFQSIPTIDFQRLQSPNPATKQATLAQLRDAIFLVGFLYLTNHGLETLIKHTQSHLPTLFSLPQPTKEKTAMLNSPSFVGYTRLGAETTASQTDLREQFDFGSPGMKPWNPQLDPIWQRLEGNSQYPDPGTQDLVETYMQRSAALSRVFMRCVAESLSLPGETFEKFKGSMDRLKFIRYPVVVGGKEGGNESRQGVGPHKDSTGLFTFLAQDDTGGLQVLNRAGEWVDVPPVEGSLVVNIQQGFEAITGGVCSATTHRVMAPTTKTRYSIPFFLGVRMDLTLEQLQESAAHIVRCIPVPDDRKKRAVDVPSEFLSPLYSCFGEAYLRNRIVSHPDVGRRWYPELYSRFTQEKLQ